MEMKVTFGNPFLIFIYSLSLLLMGDGVGIFWRREPVTAFSIVLLGSSFMVLPDTNMTLIWVWITARWAQSVRDRKRENSGKIR